LATGKVTNISGIIYYKNGKMALLHKQENRKERLLLLIASTYNLERGGMKEMKMDPKNIFTQNCLPAWCGFNSHKSFLKRSEITWIDCFAPAFVGITLH